MNKIFNEKKYVHVVIVSQLFRKKINYTLMIIQYNNIKIKNKG